MKRIFQVNGLKSFRLSGTPHIGTILDEAFSAQVHRRGASHQALLGQGMFSEASTIRPIADFSAIYEARSYLDRAQNAGHTLDANAYIHRHLSPALMSFLLHRPDIRIRLYGDELGNALRSLQSEGFVQIFRLSDNSYSDFIKVVAFNPVTRAAVVALVASPGKAYLREMAANLVYYSAPGAPRDEPLTIDPRRISAFEAPPERSPYKAFQAVLRVHRIDPDAVVTGYAAQFNRQLASQGISPAAEIQMPNLKATLYRIDGRQVLSLSIEPHLYSDRAGEFVDAALGMSRKKRLVIATGNAGSLDPRVRRGDLIIPETLSEADSLKAARVDGFANNALAVARDMGLAGEEGGHLGGNGGSVSSILFEDEVWRRIHSSGPDGLTFVEQEMASVAQAVRRNAHPEDTELHVVVDISDELYNPDATFLAKDVGRTDEGPRVRPTTMAWEILRRWRDRSGDRAAAAAPQASVRPPPAPEAVSVRARGTGILIQFSGRRWTARLPEPVERLDVQMVNDFQVGFKRIAEAGFPDAAALEARLREYAHFFSSQYGFRVSVRAGS